MKIRIKRKSKQMLNEAAMSPADLPEDFYIKLEAYGDFVEISYEHRDGLDNSIEGMLVAEKMNPQDCIANSYEITSAEATKGWGPLLYDVMMEYLTSSRNATLTSDRGMVSGDAKNVWDFYLNNRSDVEKVRLDISDQTLEWIYGSKRMAPFKQLTPDDKSDDCTQDTSVYYAVGKGDWKKHNPSHARMASIDYPEKAAKWHEQSVSYGYIKRGTKIMDELYDNGQLEMEEM
jgi:hypothetical protein